MDTALLLFFTGADLAEAKEPVEETTTSEEALEEILPWGPSEVLPERDLKEGDLGAELLLFFTRADLAEANEPVEETTDLASFLLNLELVPETSEEVLEETLPTEEKDLEEERSSSLPVAKPTTLTCSSILRPT